MIVQLLSKPGRTVFGNVGEREILSLKVLLKRNFSFKTSDSFVFPSYGKIELWERGVRSCYFLKVYKCIFEQYTRTVWKSVSSSCLLFAYLYHQRMVLIFACFQVECSVSQTRPKDPGARFPNGQRGSPRGLLPWECARASKPQYT